MNKILLSVFFVACGLLLNGCVTNIKSDVTQNPPPQEKFSAFTHFEITPVKLVAPYAGQEANEKALLKIQENISFKMTPVLAQWNSAGTSAAAPRTLLIELTIPEIKFLNATVRVWSGAMSGSSAVILRARITEKETGKVVATPEFYARAAAMAGAWSMGGADNAMLVRIANRATDYLQANYAHAVGGISGADPAAK